MCQSRINKTGKNYQKSDINYFVYLESRQQINLHTMEIHICILTNPTPAP